MKFDLNNIVRNNIKKLQPYSSARSEFKGKADVFLDANENCYGSPLNDKYNRYPDPLQIKLKEKISDIKKIPAENIFIGNGSDEAIDILFRVFCNPGMDNIIICPPTYGMYEVSANINDIKVNKINLIPEIFQLDIPNILKAISPQTKLIFICCPNNPTGNGVKWNDIKAILEKFSGIVVIDEAYINYASYKSLIPELLNYPNLVILQTLSKAWGLAGLRLGIAFATEEIISLFNKVKPPYNINQTSQLLAIEALGNINIVNQWIKETVEEREVLSAELKKMHFVLFVYDSDANFILVKMKNADMIYGYLVEKGIIIRNRSKIDLCENCLRITVGTKEENKILLDALKKIK